MKKDLIEILYENRKLVLIIGIIFVIIIGISIYFSFNKEDIEKEDVVTINLRLFGKNEVVLQNGEAYQEPGFYAIDSNGVIKTDLVNVTNNINNQEAGIYFVTYKIDDIIKTRTVRVLEKEDLSDNKELPSYLTINLKGENVITLSIGDTYIESGYEAFSNLGDDLTDKVIVQGEVDTNMPGTYTITYKVEDGKLEKEVIRTIIVLENQLELNLTLDKTSYTNSSVTITAKVEGNNFLSLTLPNNVISNKSIETYNVTSNGTYTFKAYSKSGKVVSKSINVNLIDKTSPSGSCSAVIDENNITNISVNAIDYESGIKSYSYYNSNNLLATTINSFYKYNSKLENIKVRIYDNANNYKETNCSVIDNSKVDRFENELIIIGDSRTEDMCKTSYCNACKGDKVFAKVGMGYNWFLETAIPNTNTYLNKNTNKSYNIFILMGVNGIGSTKSAGVSVSNKYYNTVENLANGKWANHYIYYVSVNPVINSSGTKAAINGFNSNMKSKIENSGLKNLKYCDTASSLSINSSNSPDGVHYNCTIYRKIYDLLKNCL